MSITKLFDLDPVLNMEMGVVDGQRHLSLLAIFLDLIQIFHVDLLVVALLRFVRVIQEI